MICGKIKNLNFHWRKSLVLQILIVFILFNIISIALFTFYIKKNEEIVLKENAEEGLLIIAEEKAQLISYMMNQVENETKNLAEWATEYITLADGTAELPEYYIFNETDILYRELDHYADHQTFINNNSNIYFPAKTKINESVKKEIIGTEMLDRKMSQLLNEIPHLQWVSIANGSGLLRTMPYMSENILGPEKQDQGPFYVIANMENNPSRDTVWTKPYVDYFGAGWVMSCTSPIDIDGKMVGVVVLDVSIKTLQEEFLGDFRLGNTGFAFILGDSGDIIYHPKYMPEDDHKWDLLMTNIFTDIRPGSEYEKAIRHMLSEKMGLTTYGGIDNSIMAYASIKGQPWVLGIEINENDFIGQSNFKTLNLIYFLVVLLILLIFITLFLYYQYSKPFSNLINHALVSSNLWQISSLQIIPVRLRLIATFIPRSC